MTNQVPEDSVLRRHYETTLRMQGAGTATQSASTQAPSGPSATATQSQQETSSGGLFGWFKRLLGG